MNLPELEWRTFLVTQFTNTPSNEPNTTFNVSTIWIAKRPKSSGSAKTVVPRIPIQQTTG